jgi:hypothetical protein
VVGRCSLRFFGVSLVEILVWYFYVRRIRDGCEVMSCVEMLVEMFGLLTCLRSFFTVVEGWWVLSLGSLTSQGIDRTGR